MYQCNDSTPMSMLKEPVTINPEGFFFDVDNTDEGEV